MTYWKQMRPGEEQPTGVRVPQQAKPDGFHLDEEYDIISMDIDPGVYELRCRAIFVFHGTYGKHESGFQNLVLIFVDHNGDCLGRLSGVDVLRFEGAVQMDVRAPRGPDRFFPPQDEHDAYFHVEIHGASTVTAWVEGIKVNA